MQLWTMVISQVPFQYPAFFRYRRSVDRNLFYRLPAAGSLWDLSVKSSGPKTIFQRSPVPVPIQVARLWSGFHW